MHDVRRRWHGASHTRSSARWRGSRDVVLSPAELLLQPEESVSQLYDVSLHDAQALLRDAARTYVTRRAAATVSGIEVRRVYDMLAPTQTRLQPHDNNDNNDNKADDDSGGVVRDWRRSHAALPTGLPSLDVALMGGLRRGFVTELTGWPGCGKTVVACNWAVHAALQTTSDTDDDDSRSSVVWLHTSASLSPSPAQVRGVVAAQHARGVCGASNGGACACDDVDERLGFVAVHDVASFVSTTCPQLDAYLTQQRQQQRQPSCSTSATIAATTTTTRSRRVDLLVLDDLTVLVRRSYAGLDGDTLARQEAVAAVLHTLKSLAERHQLAVLVLTNESSSSTSMSTSTSTTRVAAVADDHGDEQVSDGTACRDGLAAAAAVAQPDAHPGAFGRVLYHAVNVRLRLSEVCCVDTSRRQRAKDEEQLLHCVTVLKSPVCGAVRVLLRCSGLDVCEARLDEAGTTSATNDGNDDDNVDERGVVVGDTADVHTAPCVVPCDDAYAMLDGLDYTTVPTFVYV